MATLPGKSVKVVLTDPPYGMGWQSNRKTTGLDSLMGDYDAAARRQSQIEADKDLEAALDLLNEVLTVLEPKMQDECHLLIFTGWRYEPEFRALLSAIGYDLRASIVWEKENHGTGDLKGFAPKHERIIHATKGGAGTTRALTTY